MSSARGGSERSEGVAAVLANGLLDTHFAKTTHGLIRGPSRFRIAGVVDGRHAGRDVGEVVDGRARGIFAYASLDDLLRSAPETPDTCVVGVATPGGVLPDDLRSALLQAAGLGWKLVNGLHQSLAEIPEIARAGAAHDARIVDLRRPRPIQDLQFWSGEILHLETPRVAVLGTDCAIGKRTTAVLLRDACRARGWPTELIYTGQTGWLQGHRYGFILDATPNDFVCGELERAILDCARETETRLMLLEGQASLRNPSGPCGSELILGGGAAGVVLQHAPTRTYYEDMERLGVEIGSLGEEIELIRLLGGEVWAVTLNQEGLDRQEAVMARDRLRSELNLPVFLPLGGDLESLADLVLQRLQRESKA